MSKYDLSKIYLGLTVYAESQLRSFRHVLTVLEEKENLLAGILPFTIRDELQLNEAAITYADRSISLLEFLKKHKSDIPINETRCSRSITHLLLREYRNENHHHTYLPFVACDVTMAKTRKFLIWPILRSLTRVKKRHPVWCETANLVELGELLTKHQDLIDDLKREALACITDSLGDTQILVSLSPSGLFHPGPSPISNEDSWKL